MNRYLPCFALCVSLAASHLGAESMPPAVHAFGSGGQVKMPYDRRQRPNAVWLNDRVYLAYNGGGDPDSEPKAKTRPMLVAYDPEARTFSEPVVFDDEDKDHHMGPVIWADTAGHLHVLYGCHRTPGVHLVCRRSDTIGDGPEDWEELPPIAAGLSYPTFHRTGAGRQLVYYRTSGHTSSWTYRISDDRGVTWAGPPRDVTDLDLNGRIDWSSYHTTLPSRDGRYLHVAFIAYDDVKTDPTPQRFFNPRYGVEVPNEWKYNLYYLRIDLATHVVTNSDGREMKTPVDLDAANAHARIWDTEWRGAGVPPTIELDAQGNPTFLHVLSGQTLDEHRYYYVRRESGRWRQTPITASNHQWNSCHLVRDSDGILHAYLVVGPGYLDTGGYMDSYGGGTVEEWISKDEGDHWSRHRDLTPDRRAYPSWKYNNIQPVTRPDGSRVDGLLLFYGWPHPDAPRARGFLLHESTE